MKRNTKNRVKKIDFLILESKKEDKKGVFDKKRQEVKKTMPKRHQVVCVVKCRPASHTFGVFCRHSFLKDLWGGRALSNFSVLFQGGVFFFPGKI